MILIIKTCVQYKTSGQVNPKTLGTLRRRCNETSILALVFVGAPRLGTGNLLPQMTFQRIRVCQCVVTRPFTPPPKL